MLNCYHYMDIGTCRKMTVLTRMPQRILPFTLVMIWFIISEGQHIKHMPTSVSMVSV
jgi:hypothetical protein